MAEPAHRPTSIRIFLADGTPEGLKIVGKSNWSGQALTCSRSQYPDARQREEFGRTGVYLLVGPGSSSSQPAVYVGEADVARDRLNQHFRTKDFWTSLILFSANDGNLNKAHVRYLESRLLGLAQKAKRAELENNAFPAIPPLSEADCADAEWFLQEMLLIFPLLGVTAFEPAVGTKSRRAMRLFLKGREAEAEGRDTAEGFLVCEGSLARMNAVPSTHNYLLELRSDLLQRGVLEVAPGSESYRFTLDYLFNSPSTAAGVVLGRSANGRVEWVDRQGRTLKSLQEASLDEPSGEAQA